MTIPVPSFPVRRYLLVLRYPLGAWSPDQRPGDRELVLAAYDARDAVTRARLQCKDMGMWDGQNMRRPQPVDVLPCP